MPPRIPTRALSALPLSNGAVASSSTVPLPPQRQRSPTSPRPQARGICSSSSTASTSTSSHRHHRQASSSTYNPSKPHSRSFHSSNPSLASAKNPYDVLGVKKDASASDIKKTYYQLAKKWHPDSNKEKGANERFVEIQQAYDILSDESKRQAYDRYGDASTQEGFDPNAFGAGGFGGFQDFGSAFGGRPGSAGDLFESLFGGAFGGAGGGGPFGSSGRSRVVRGDPIEVSVNVSFLEACLGASRRINITPVVDCNTCSGSGLKAGKKKTQCSTCRGTGNQTFQVQGMFMSTTCQSCGGEGSMIPRDARCKECEGVGRVKERKEVMVDIPAGIEDGMKIQIPGMGDMPLTSAAGGQRGDLNVRVNVSSSPMFRRQGTNLYHDAKVPLHVALLGGRVRIPTLEGEVEVRVREGTQNGEEAVMKGRGVKSLIGGRSDRERRGDLVVQWKVQIPRSLSPFQKKIMQAYADDVAGIPPNIHFGEPPSSTGSSEGMGATTNGTASSSSAKSSSASSYSSTSPNIEDGPEPLLYRDEESRSSEGGEGLAGKAASAIGGALGWVERLFGSGSGSGGGAKK